MGEAITLLQALSIHNFAIISELNVQFDDGMTVLTGETGAGKSIVIDAVGLLLGGRGSTDYIRTGMKKAQLEGHFVAPDDHPIFQKMMELGLDCDESDIIIQRDLHHNGKNTCRINGHLVNTTMLKEIGPYLVDIQGQHDHQLLMQPEHHLSLLDQFAPASFQQLKQDYQQLYHDYHQLYHKMMTMKENEQAYVQRMDMLQFQINEIEEAQLEEDEEDKLVEERRRLSNFQRIADQLERSYLALNNEEAGTLTTLGDAMSSLEDIASLSDEYQELSTRLSDVFYSLQDIVSDISQQQDQMEMDDARLDEIEERLRLIRSLERKYGATIADVLDYYKKIKEEFQQSRADIDNLDGMEAEVEALHQQALEKAKALSVKRHEIAKQLEEDIHQQLTDLYMEQAKFHVHFTEEETLSKDGLEKVEFYIATNKGEDLKPLAKVVSGGELSRVMLALKTIFMKEEAVTSIVFDEVDTGVSGRVAQAIAEKISQIAKQSQVLCITHLPQVAAMADHHYFIQKAIENDRTLMKLTTLNEKERVNELARMLAGTEITPLSIEHAEEMLKQAHQS